MTAETGQADAGQALPRSGLRVLDAGRYISGPFCARLFARLGADVIKVEPPGRGDPVRAHGPFRAGAARGESGPLHLYLNEGKRAITLNLRSESGRRLFLRLAERCDAVIENFEPRVLPALGLDYATLREARHSLVLSSISSFGDSGPYRDFKASELTIFSMGGHVYRSGVAGRPPVRMGGYPAQYLAGISAAYATMLALRAAQQSGEGQRVELCTMESQVTSHAQAMVEISYYGEETGARLPRTGGAIRGVKARDGIAMLAVQEQQMARLAALVGAPPELGRPNPMDAGSGQRALREHVDAWAAVRTRREVYEQGQQAQVPASFVASPADLLDSPQYRHRGFIARVDHTEAGEVAIPGVPFAWEGAVAPPRPAPRLGEHNAEVYRSLLGLSNEDLVRLAGAGVI